MRAEGGKSSWIVAKMADDLEDYYVDMERRFAWPKEQPPPEGFASPQQNVKGTFVHFKGAQYDALGCVCRDRKIHAYGGPRWEQTLLVLYTPVGQAEQGGPFWLRSLDDWSASIPRFRKI